MKRILMSLFVVALLSMAVRGEELVHYSGHLIKYDEPAGSPKAMFCLRHPQSHLFALWLVGVDLSHLEKETYILVEGVIHTKYIPSKGPISSIPDTWEVWMEVRSYKVIKDDFAAVDFNEPIAKPSAPTNGVAAQPPITLRSDQFIDSSLTLVSDSQYEYYRFGTNGLVAATFGEKKGPLIAPALYWRLDQGNTLVITDTPGGEKHEMESRFQFTLITDSDAIMTDGRKWKRERFQSSAPANGAAPATE